MKHSIACLFGLHQYEVHKEDILMNTRKEIIGKVIISRCKYCGKIINNRIYTLEN